LSSETLEGSGTGSHFIVIFLIQSTGWEEKAEAKDIAEAVVLFLNN